MNQQQQQQSSCDTSGGSPTPTTTSSTASHSPATPTFAPPPHGQQGGGYAQQPPYGQQGLYGQQGYPQQHQQQPYSLPWPPPNDNTASSPSTPAQAGPGPSTQQYQQQQQYQQSQQYYQQQQQWQPPQQQQQQPMMGGFGGMGGMGGMGDMGGGAGMGANPYMMGAMMMMQLMGQGGMSMSGLNGMMGSAEPPTKKRKKDKNHSPSALPNPFAALSSLSTASPASSLAAQQEQARARNVQLVLQSAQLAAYKRFAQTQQAVEAKAKKLPGSTWRYTVTQLGSGTKLAESIQDVEGNTPFYGFDLKKNENRANKEWDKVLGFAKQCRDWFLADDKTFGAQDGVALEVTALLIEQAFPSFRLCKDHARALALLKSRVDHKNSTKREDPRTFELDKIEWVGEDDEALSEEDDDENEGIDLDKLDEKTRKLIVKMQKKMNKNALQFTSSTFDPPTAAKAPTSPESVSLAKSLSGDLTSPLSAAATTSTTTTTAGTATANGQDSEGVKKAGLTDGSPEVEEEDGEMDGKQNVEGSVDGRGGLASLIPSQAAVAAALEEGGVGSEVAGGKGEKSAKGKKVKMVESSCGVYKAPANKVIDFLKEKGAYKPRVTKPDKLRMLLLQANYNVDDVVDWMKPPAEDA